MTLKEIIDVAEQKRLNEARAKSLLETGRGRLMARFIRDQVGGEAIKE